jgi:hypothetical protein
VFPLSSFLNLVIPNDCIGRFVMSSHGLTVLKKLMGQQSNIKAKV